jgi:hypothetical protein
MPMVTAYIKENCASGSHTFSLPTMRTDTYAEMTIIEFGGVPTSGVVGAVNIANSPSNTLVTTFNISVTNTVADAIMVALGSPGGNGAIAAYTSPQSGYTSVDIEDNGGSHVCYSSGQKTVSSTASQAASWSWNGVSTDFQALILEIKGTSSGTSYDLTVDPASYTLTAAAETLVAARNLTVSPASYALTAPAVNLAVGRALNVSPASYTLSAAAVTMAVGRVLNVSPASYALTAADVTLTYAPSLKELVVDPASYTVSAADVSFAVTRALSIDPASYSLTNSAETLSVGRVLSVNPASYALSASAQTLAVGRVLSVDPVAYALTLADVTLDYRPTNPVLSVDPVSYSLSLADVEFEYGRSGGGRDDAKKKIRKRVNELNKKILQAEAQEIAEIAVTQAKSAPKSADQGHDEDEEEALMLLL